MSQLCPRAASVRRGLGASGGAPAAARCRLSNATRWRSAAGATEPAHPSPSPATGEGLAVGVATGGAVGAGVAVPPVGAAAGSPAGPGEAPGSAAVAAGAGAPPVGLRRGVAAGAAPVMAVAATAGDPLAAGADGLAVARSQDAPRASAPRTTNMAMAQVPPLPRASTGRGPGDASRPSARVTRRANVPTAELRTAPTLTYRLPDLKTATPTPRDLTFDDTHDEDVDVGNVELDPTRVKRPRFRRSRTPTRPSRESLL